MLEGLVCLDDRGELAGSSTEVAGEHSPALQLGVGAFADTAQARLGAVGGLLRLGQRLLAPFAFVSGDHVGVQADVAEVGEQPEEGQNLVGDLEPAGGGDVDGAAR